MRKFLLTFVVLVAGAMSAWAQVAKIGDVPYATLAEAVAAAENGATITVQSDVTLDATLVVPAGKTITLDLNGKTISMVDGRTTAGSCEMIINNGNLTIQSSVEGGKLSYTYSGANLGTTYYANTVTAKPGSVLTVKSGTIENLTYDQAVIAYAIDGQTNGGAGDVTVNIEGGVITSKRQAVRIFANSITNTGTLNISGGEITGRVIVQNANAKANKATLAVTGGTFNPNAYKTDVLYVGGNNSATIAIDAAVSGGTFNGAITETAVEGFISGGTFSAAAVASIQGTNLLAEGAELGEPGADGSCTVVSPGAILEINNLDDFLAFRGAVNGGNSFAGVTVLLNTDLDFNELYWTENIGNAEHPFEGIFDGQGNTIKNLYLVSRPGVARDYLGLFGVISGGAVIKNVVLEDLYFVPGGGGQYVGTIVAYASNGVTIQGNVVNKLKVEGTEYVGGLVGYASNNVVIVGNTVQNLTVQGTSSVGAVAGKILAGAEVVDNKIVDVLVIASGDASTAAVVAGTFEDGVIISGTKIQGEVKVNGAENTNPVSTAAKVGNAYYLTLDAAATDGEDKEIEVELFGKHTLADDVSYEHTNTVTVNGDLTYTRNLTGNWNPIYFPFDYKFDTNVYTVAEFVDGEGATLTLQLVENGELKANRPYVVRPNDREAKELSVKLDGRTLVRAKVEELELGKDFVLLGNNKKVNGSAIRSMLEDKYDDPDFHTPRVVGSKDGSWGILGNNTNLKPYRLILAGPAEVVNGQKAISMRILSGTTVVEEVVLDAQEAEAIFDLMGRRVETMTKGEIYIVNGKKVIF